MRLAISEVTLGPGWLGICPMPGRGGDYAGDLQAIRDWGAELVLTMTTSEELQAKGAGDLGADLAAAGILWAHLPLQDFTAPPPEMADDWARVSRQAHGILRQGGRVLAHCMGGCGRSGTALLRLMIETGEAPEAALTRLRAARPCAVEKPAQFAWAAAGVTAGAAE